MDTAAFFDIPATMLPRDRDDEDFERYLSATFERYRQNVAQLDPSCRIGAQILGAQAEIKQLGDLILEAVRKYLSGSPAAAYERLAEGVERVYSRLNSLQSIAIDPDSVGALYRLARTNGVLPGKARLFHTPFELRYKVGQHRYGIPGFPCLYLGGSLDLCAAECRISDVELPRTAVAEFVFRRSPKLLDFGYRPFVMGRYAQAALHGNNRGLDDLVVSYAVCWPLLAACSVKRMHDNEPFAHEYIVPQMVLQWVMNKEECDGIRFFSTRFDSEQSPIKKVVNYVFPATHDINPAHNYSARLRDLFDFTDPILWDLKRSEELEFALSLMKKTSL